MPNILEVFLLSMTPVGELRLAIPIGLVVYKLNPTVVLFVSILGSIMPAVFILFFFEKFSLFFSKKSPFLKKFFDWWTIKTKTKHSEKIEKYGTIGLFFFIAIPLPFTGVWTGSLLATLMNLNIKKSLPAIFLGTTTSGILVTFAILLGINIQQYFDWQVLIAMILAISLIYLYLKKIKKI